MNLEDTELQLSNHTYSEAIYTYRVVGPMLIMGLNRPPVEPKVPEYSMNLPEYSFILKMSSE